jgi:hypothetical protein
MKIFCKKNPEIFSKEEWESKLRQEGIRQISNIDYSGVSNSRDLSDYQDTNKEGEVYRYYLGGSRDEYKKLE